MRFTQMIMLPEVKMNLEEPMTIEERYPYLRRRKKQYPKADRQERSRLLDETETAGTVDVAGTDQSAGILT